MGYFHASKLLKLAFLSSLTRKYVLWKGFYHYFSTNKASTPQGASPGPPRFPCPPNDLPWRRLWLAVWEQGSIFLIFADFDTLNTARAVCVCVSAWKTTLFLCFCTQALYLPFIQMPPSFVYVTIYYLEHGYHLAHLSKPNKITRLPIAQNMVSQWPYDCQRLQW